MNPESPQPCITHVESLAERLDTLQETLLTLQIQVNLAASQRWPVELGVDSYTQSDEGIWSPEALEQAELWTELHGMRQQASPSHAAEQDDELETEADLAELAELAADIKELRSLVSAHIPQWYSDWHFDPELPLSNQLRGVCDQLSILRASIAAVQLSPPLR